MPLHKRTPPAYKTREDAASGPPPQKSSTTLPSRSVPAGPEAHGAARGPALRGQGDVARRGLAGREFGPSSSQRAQGFEPADGVAVRAGTDLEFRQNFDGMGPRSLRATHKERDVIATRGARPAGRRSRSTAASRSATRATATSPPTTTSAGRSTRSCWLRATAVSKSRELGSTASRSPWPCSTCTRRASATAWAPRGTAPPARTPRDDPRRGRGVAATRLRTVAAIRPKDGPRRRRGVAATRPRPVRGPSPRFVQRTVRVAAIRRSDRRARAPAGDLKLSNVFMARDGHVVVGDFGFAKTGVGFDDYSLRTFCGTVECLAPELLRGATYGFPVDWWAFGVALSRRRADDVSGTRGAGASAVRGVDEPSGADAAASAAGRRRTIRAGAAASRRGASTDGRCRGRGGAAAAAAPRPQRRRRASTDHPRRRRGVAAGRRRDDAR